MTKTTYAVLLIFIGLLSACRNKIRENKDEIYSRHLQKHINLTIISTPVPDNKGDFNLLLLNDGQEVENLRVKKTVDSLYSKKLIQPVVVVAIDAADRMQQYGVAGIPDYQNNGMKADKYADFIINELLPFVKKNSGVRKFNSIIFAGCSLGALSALDISWDHADKINKVGMFSGSFWFRDKAATDSTYSDDKNRIIINKIRSSRKRPKLKYWFYAGASEETADRDSDGIIDVVDDTKDLITQIQQKKVSPPQDIVYTEGKSGTHDYDTWSKVFPQFLLWAIAK